MSLKVIPGRPRIRHSSGSKEKLAENPRRPPKDRVRAKPSGNDPSSQDAGEAGDGNRERLERVRQILDEIQIFVRNGALEGTNRSEIRFWQD